MTAPTVPSAPRPRRGCGCLGCLPALLFGVLLVIALQGLLNPWAFHMGGRLTFLEWSGIGVMQCSNGARDVVYARLVVARRGHAIYSRFSRAPSTFTGEARVGTPQGVVRKFRLSGSLHGAWWDADGAPVSIELRTPRGVNPAEVVELHGAFHGTRLVLEDHGQTGHLFRPDGSLDPVGGRFFSTADKPDLRLVLDFGDLSRFDALERRLTTAAAARR